VFSVVLGLLAAFAILVFALARYVGKTEQLPNTLQDPLVRDSVAERLAPPVRVAVAGQDNSALTIAPVTTAASAVVTVKLETGLLGAPRIGDAANWAPRLAQGKNTLYDHAINGFKGKTGEMPAKGGRTDISDELARAAVDHMLGD